MPKGLENEQDARAFTDVSLLGDLGRAYDGLSDSDVDGEGIPDLPSSSSHSLIRRTTSMDIWRQWKKYLG
jgi:hypothetical protein